MSRRTPNVLFPAGVASPDAGHVVNPLLAAGRVQVAVLHGEPLQPALVQLLAPLQHELAVVRMQVLHPELEDAEALRHVRGNATDLGEAVVDEDGTRAEVDLVEAEAGEIGRLPQARLALLQAQLVASADERVGEDLRDQLEPLDQRVGPVALRAQGVESQGAYGGLTAHRERDAQGRLDAEPAAGVPIDGGLRGQVLDRGSGDQPAGQHLLDGPGVLLLAHRVGRTQAFLGAVGVGGHDHPGGCGRPLPQHRQVDPERLADTAQPVLDLAVDLVGRKVDEAGREVGDQRLELEEARLGVARRRIVRRHGPKEYTHRIDARPIWPAGTSTSPWSRDAGSFKMSGAGPHAETPQRRGSGSAGRRSSGRRSGPR